jgi:hypothetical protein
MKKVWVPLFEQNPKVLCSFQIFEYLCLQVEDKVFLKHLYILLK